MGGPEPLLPAPPPQTRGLELPAGGLWAQYDQGRAWLEFEFARDGGGHEVAVVTYAGRARHSNVEQFARILTARAGLSWNPSSHPADTTDLPAREIIWERRRGGRDAER